MVIVPLLSHNQVIGILYATKEAPFGFDKDDVDVISAFADQATIAIENARLIQEEMEKRKMEEELIVAQEIQRGLLPATLPLIPNFEIAGNTISSKHVGGDYYDFIELGKDRLGVVIADVAGKGIPAAFYMTMIKGIIQSLALTEAAPHELLKQINWVIRPHKNLISPVKNKKTLIH